jgi:hypothetical protein
MWLTPRAILGLFMLFAVLVLPQLAGIAGWRYRKLNCVQAGITAAVVFVCAWFAWILLLELEDSSMSRRASPCPSVCIAPPLLYNALTKPQLRRTNP